MATQVTRLKASTAVSHAAGDTIEDLEKQHELFLAQERMQRRLHDLRTEFLKRESDVRETYLEEVRGIVGE